MTTYPEDRGRRHRAFKRYAQSIGVRLTDLIDDPNRWGRAPAWVVAVAEQRRIARNRQSAKIVSFGLHYGRRA